MAERITVAIPNTRFSVSMEAKKVEGRLRAQPYSVQFAQRGPRGPRGQIGPTGVTRLAEASDVDVSNVTDGDALIYNNSDRMFRPAKPQIGEAIIDGGNF